jgi:hypothetical protein
MSDKSGSLINDVFAHVDKAMDAAGDAIKTAGKVVEAVFEDLTKEEDTTRVIRIRLDEESLRLLAKGQGLVYKTDKEKIILRF